MTYAELQEIKARRFRIGRTAKWKRVESPNCQFPHSVAECGSADGGSTQVVHSIWAHSQVVPQLEFIANAPADIDSLVAAVEQHEKRYHELMDAVRNSRRKHGDCESGKRYGGKPLACTACMAALELEELISKYKGRTVTIA